ncbi:PepSY domain-containing protein [Methylobacter sp.]|jgi:uncharacterized membrane protein YkoI|uniref:PepSY domain-containing protein n=1 Tax=Methylobacter sp. TaxID=2051955 RepID=UPI003DA4D801
MAFNRLFLIFYGILTYTNPAVELLAGGTPSSNYKLPSDKEMLESCRQAALEAVPGKVVSFQIHNVPEGLHYRFEIEAQDQIVWEVVCEVASQKIIRTQRQRELR